ncbi:MAG: phosphoribosylformimino-5-aminoimidazole carboxamide ribotide isomerase [Lachnospiraceae bacterium]|nr:phosphoribosylformimino-5-aminoimidazole carboxamide ribotide isomerase [Lachnospiraceae bacterium]
MEFRPCIDIHDGKVKQIVGSTLSDATGTVDENFVSGQGPEYYADLFRKNSLTGGHVIILNKAGTDGYEASKRAALAAARAWPQGFSIGGGMNPENAPEFMAGGAGAVIVTSYLFEGGVFSQGRLAHMLAAVGSDHLVLDLSAWKEGDGKYHVVIDRWQTVTDFILTPEVIEDLSSSCAEFLIHGTAVEGKKAGIDEGLVKLLGECRGKPVTYAGGIRSLSDIEEIRRLGNDRVNFTVGSALDIYGGTLSFADVVKVSKG